MPATQKVSSCLQIPKIKISGIEVNKMRKLAPYILLILCAIFNSCERIENGEDFVSKEVKLFARTGVHIISQQTKGDGVITSTSTRELNIGLFRLDEPEGSSNNYPYFKQCTTPLTAVLRAPEDNLRLVDFTTAQFYKNSQAEVTYTAWYPWPTQTTDGYRYTTDADSTTISFPIPATGDSDIMYSNSVKGKLSTGFEVMQFNHALSLFKIYAYKSTSKKWGKITSVSITEMPDSCSITLPSSNIKSGYRIRYANSQKNTNGITMTYDRSDLLDTIPAGFENKSFIKEWIGAPSELYTSNSQTKVLNISVTTQAEGMTGITNNIAIARNFMPGHMYDIVLRFSDDGVVNAEIQVSDWQTDSSVKDIYSNTEVSNVFYNLSENETANCYIVSSANFSYCFDATIKGNGSTAAMPGARLDPTLNPKNVKIIWSEVDTTTTFKLETNKIVEGKVLFTVNGNNDKSIKTLTEEGNVLLGVYDENGKCIWTWHIWITDKPQKQNYTKGYVVLDRNLGATASAPEKNGSSEKMKGLFYQWGRPTPFRIIDAPAVTVDDDGQTVTKIIDGEDRQERVTPDEAVANPKLFYGRFENPGAAGSDANFHDWVDRDKFRHINNLWGYREEEHEKPIKTMYDPCPPGYHVPYSRNWGNMDAYWLDKTTTDWSTLNGIKLRIEGTVDIWYPFQGYINKDGKYKEGHMHIANNTAEHDSRHIVEVWSSLINRHVLNDTDDDYPYRFMFTQEQKDGKYSRLSDAYSNRSRGLAVRCVSDNTADVVKDLSASQTANCYMIHGDGYYKFKATVRGNGVGSLLPLGGTTTAEINGGLSTTISPARVDILWWQGDFIQGTTDFPENEITEANNRTEPPQNLCISLLDNGVICEDGFVSFQISNFKEGNAVLAAYDEYDEILWSWHIWLTDKPEDKISGNYTKMDRFLGATYAPVLEGQPSQIEWGTNDTEKINTRQATFGFYYQWGKKDPIIGPPAINSGNENATTNNTSVNSAGWWKKVGNKWTYRKKIDVKGQTSVKDVVKDPTAFYKSTTTDSQQSSQWFPANFADAYTNVAMWGYAVADYSLQGQTFSKTMHDPCPPGYRTPFHFSWRYDGTYKYAEGDAGEATTSLSNSENGWDSYGIVTNKEPYFEKMWFPFAGYRSPTTGGYVNVGSYGYMNTGMPMGQYNTRSFWYNNNKSGQYAGKHGSAYGKMVRCMKE